MRSTLLVLALLLVAACDSVGDASVGPTGEVVVALGYDLSPQLQIQTVDFYNCLGYRIETEAESGDGEIDVALGDVLPPAGDVCLTAEGPAEATIALPRDIGGAPYRVLLSRDGERDEYEVRLGFSGYDIRAVRTSFSSLAE